MTTEINPIPLSDSKTEVGSYFISNYPPSRSGTIPPSRRLKRPSKRRQIETFPLSLHPYSFCRKRCRFCYFRVYMTRMPPPSRTTFRRSSKKSNSSAKNRP